MMLTKLDEHQHRWDLAMLASAALLGAWLVLRSRGLFPAVFADEWIYSNFSRLSPLKDSTIPSYLYLALYSLTNSCGNHFLGCARLLNCVFFAGAAPFFYLAARQVASPRVALAVALMALLFPFNSYTAYFMPEAMYFFAFAVLTWVAIACRGLQWARYAVLTGAVLGVMALVKVHALFLAPAFCLFTAFVTWNDARTRASLVFSIATAFLTLLAVLGAKFAVGYAIAGDAGLHLLGSFYGDQASGSIGAGARLFKLLPMAFINLRGHLLGMAVIFALPVAIAAHGLLSREARAKAGPTVVALQLFAVLMLGSAFAMTVLYTASISEFGPGEGLRLHVRYYSFGFPLLLLVAAAALQGPQRREAPALAWLLVGLLAIGLVTAVFKLPTYHLSMIDGPEFASLDLRASFGRIIVGTGLLLLLLWPTRGRAAARLFLFVFMPLWLINANLEVGGFQGQVAKPDRFDSAGLMARDYVKKSEHKDITVAGTNLAELLRAKFHIDDPDVGLIELPDDVPFNAGMTPGNRKWLLVVGNHELPPELKPVVRNPEYALIKIENSHRAIASANLFGPLPTAVLTGVDGMADAEPWGRWSNGKIVTLHFANPLPKRLNLMLKAQAYGPNAGADFKVRAGNASTSFRVLTLPQEAFMRLETDGRQKTLTIEVPQPVSPKSMGNSTDVRELGLGLISLEIGTPND